MIRVPYPIVVGVLAIFAGGITLGALAASMVAPVPKETGASPASFTQPIRPASDAPAEMWIEPGPEDVTAMLPPVALTGNDYAIWQYPEPDYDEWEPEGFSYEQEAPPRKDDSLAEAQDEPPIDARKSDLTQSGLY